jgi:hypothetical protein
VSEGGWLACGDPRPMLAFLRGKVSDRKLRLFSCAAARLCGYYRLVERPPDLEAIRRVEEWAGGGCQAGLADVEAIAQTAGAKWASGPDPFAGAENHASAAHAEPGQLTSYCSRVRCIFGNPFRPSSINPTWLAWDGGTVVKLAEAAYEQRAEPRGLLDATRLSVLADALEDAGCTDSELVSHLRSPEPHVRGCWAVDLVRGRS